MPCRADGVTFVAGREVQLFVSHRIVDLHRWDRAVDGTPSAHSNTTEAGEVTRWHGMPDDIELAIGPPPTVALAAGVRVSEDDVMRVAAAWSVDPTSLEGRPAPGPLHMGWFPCRKSPTELQTPHPSLSITDLLISDLSEEEVNERIEQRLASGRRSYHPDLGTLEGL